MTVELVFRLLGALLFGAAGWYLGAGIDASFVPRGVPPLEFLGAGIGLIGGFVLAPYISTRPASFVVEQARRLHVKDLVAAVFGLLVALILSALLAVPWSLLPGILGRILPFAGCLFLAYLGVTIAIARRDDLFGLVGLFGAGGGEREPVGGDAALRGGALLDTSAIIDGRIADIARVGFVIGPILVPRFVLHELQYIADSADPLRRARGRRGLELVERLRKISAVPVRIYDADVDGDGVDAKLVTLAQALRCAVVTNDFNLNHVARLQGVKVLNVNELANAVKTAVLPGEEMVVHIIQEGKEPGQGVGYLEDGTMVVVDGGRARLHSEVSVVVTRVFQTAAGRMIFAQARGARETRSTA
jgi:uncharacterized protein YacL